LIVFYLKQSFPGIDDDTKGRMAYWNIDILQYHGTLIATNNPLFNRSIIPV